jgi:hypothetical protein
LEHARQLSQIQVHHEESKIERVLYRLPAPVSYEALVDAALHG